jgi:hypothetical protein
MNRTDRFRGRVGFAVGTGRCGTKFMAQVIGMEPRVASSHERNILNESFHRYCKWYGLPVDHEGFLQAKEAEIREDLQEHVFSFEASAQLSSSIHELYERFGARFVLLARSPDRVVNSFMRKTVYEKPFVCGNPHLALGYQPCEDFHHFLGRIAPVGETFEPWNEMTRVGKLAWYWNAVHADIFEQMENIPEAHRRVERIEDLSFSRYLETARFLGFKVTIGKQIYDDLVRRRPNALRDVPTVAAWTASEAAEFEAEVAPMAERLGYEYRVERILSRQERRAGERSGKNPPEIGARENPSMSSRHWWQRILLRLRTP